MSNFDKRITELPEMEGNLTGEEWINVVSNGENVKVKTDQFFIDGEPGLDGDTPYIGENGNWFIGETDTGVLADVEQAVSEHNTDETAHPFLATKITDMETGIKDRLDEIIDLLTPEEVPDWQPHPDWWDIKKIFEDDPDPNKRFILLLADSVNTETLDATIGNATAYYKTSDGATYQLDGTNTTFTHTWNRLLDKPCSEGYKTRYLIIYSENENINVDIRTRAVLWAYVGNGSNITSLMAGGTTVNTANIIIQSIEFTDDVIINSIPDYSLASCFSLRLINIPDGVTNIGTNAFNSCYALKSINIPDGVTNIKDKVFAYCASLRLINIPDGVTYIGTNAFTNCHSLSSVNIPDGVTYIGNSAFVSCYSLRSINIPDGVVDIFDSTFSAIYTLQSVNIPISVKSIAGNAFLNCFSIQSVNISEGWVAPANFNVSSSIKFSISSMLDIFNKLGNAVVATTLTFGAINLAKLTPDEKAIATNKGYTLA